jgi:hypothetical protein
MLDSEFLIITSEEHPGMFACVLCSVRVRADQYTAAFK